jgi:YfiH family protein
MITNPFPSLQRFSFLDLQFLRREDNISSDTDIARVTGKKKIVGLWQKHGNIALRVDVPSSRVLQADAIATDTPGLTLTIRFADCQNAIILSPAKKVITLVHAGWRGVRANVMTSTYELLKKEWNIDPQETFVGLGPALCLQCSGFTDPEKEIPELKDLMHDKTVDLRGALDAELASIGVPASQIERMADCTRCHPETYFTYRGGDREKVTSGFVNVFAVTLRP